MQSCSTQALSFAKDGNAIRACDERKGERRGRVVPNFAKRAIARFAKYGLKKTVTLKIPNVNGPFISVYLILSLTISSGSSSDKVDNESSGDIYKRTCLLLVSLVAIAPES